MPLSEWCTLSRFAEDLIFFNTGEAGFVELSDCDLRFIPDAAEENPDALELIRGRNVVVQALTGMMMTLKALPLVYNKDMQEDKEGLFDASIPGWTACIWRRWCWTAFRWNAHVAVKRPVGR